MPQAPAGRAEPAGNPPRFQTPQWQKRLHNTKQGDFYVGYFTTCSYACTLEYVSESVLACGVVCPQAWQFHPLADNFPNGNTRRRLIGRLIWSRNAGPIRRSPTRPRNKNNRKTLFVGCPCSAWVSCRGEETHPLTHTWTHWETDRARGQFWGVRQAVSGELTGAGC